MGRGWRLEVVQDKEDQLRTDETGRDWSDLGGL